jgi:predicted dehydrogenase
MFDDMGGEFDAVSIATPDFSHFPVTMMALAEGKHVYVEKPMARTFQEVDLMIAAAKKYPKLATQMGNQGHSEANYFQFKTWKEAGIIKDVTAITAHMNSQPSLAWMGPQYFPLSCKPTCSFHYGLGCLVESGTAA